MKYCRMCRRTCHEIKNKSPDNVKARIRCILLDDELPGLTFLKILCGQIPELEVVKAYNNPQALLADLPSLEFDLCILDIEMPGMDGLSIANLLHGKPVIFTTAYKEYAADAFDLNAVDYIRKPVQKERLKAAVGKVKERLEHHKPEKSFVRLNTNKGKTLLFFDQVAYIAVSETDSRDKLVVLEDSSSLLLKNISFEKLIGLLPERKFCQINKKEVIAIRFVQYFSHDEVSTSIIHSSGRPMVFTLGHVYRKDFLRKVKE